MKNCGKFTQLERIIFASTFLTAFISGITWLALHYFLDLMYHIIGAKVLMIHGISGLFGMFLLGIIWKHASHELKMKRKKNRTSGLILLFCFGIICITGVGLYYIGNESVRNIASAMHWIFGILVFITLVIHVPLPIAH